MWPSCSIKPGIFVVPAPRPTSRQSTNGANSTFYLPKGVVVLRSGTCTFTHFYPYYIRPPTSQLKLQVDLTRGTNMCVFSIQATKSSTNYRGNAPMDHPSRSWAARHSLKGLSRPPKPPQRGCTVMTRYPSRSGKGEGTGRPGAQPPRLCSTSVILPKISGTVLRTGFGTLFAELYPHRYTMLRVLSRPPPSPPPPQPLSHARA